MLVPCPMKTSSSVIVFDVLKLNLLLGLVKTDYDGAFLFEFLYCC